MNYRNEKLNISIVNGNYFDEIRENDGYVSLIVDGVEKFRIYSNSIVRAYSNSTVKARDNSTVYARDNSTVEAWGNSTVKAWGNSTVEAWGNSTVEAWGNSTVKAWGNSTVEAWGNSTVRAYSNSTVKAWGNSTVRAYFNSTVYARDNSTVEAWGNSTVRAYEFSCVYIKSTTAKIKTDNHFGAIIKQVFKTTKKTIVYKKLQNDRIAVLELEKGQVFQSENHDKCRTDHAKVLRIESLDGKTQFQDGISQRDSNFKYIVGETVSAEYDETIKECSTGIHFFLTREKAERY